MHRQNFDYFYNMILVTGATGLVGTHLLLKLTQTEERVRATYRDEAKIALVSRMFDLEHRASDFNKISWINADLLKVDELDEALLGVQTIYNCAGFVSFEPKDYQKLLKENVEGTANLVNCALHAKVRVICHVSSIAALGVMPQSNLLVDETAEWNRDSNNSDYAISKFGAEIEIWRAQQEGIQVIIVNPGVILGKSFAENPARRIYEQAVGKLWALPSGRTGFVDVIDVVSIMTELVKQQKFGNRFLLIEGNYRFAEIVNKLRNASAKKTIQRRIPPFVLWLLSFGASIVATVTFGKRNLSYATVRSLLDETQYDNQLICRTLSYSFRPIDVTLKDITAFYFTKK